MENTQDGTLRNWFKITFHYANNWARFFVQRASAAFALKDVSYKICDEENQKIPIFVSTSAVPYSVRDKLEPKEMEQLKLTMNKRYDPSKKALELHKLCFDPDLVGINIDIILNRRNCMAATLQIIEKNFPELLSLNLRNNKLYQLDGLSDLIQRAPTVKILNLSKNQLKSVCDLDKVKGLKPKAVAGRKPLVQHFPRPVHLHKDGQELLPIVTDIVGLEIIKLCKESYKGSETLKNLVFQFLLQSSLCKYFKISRNMKKVKDCVAKGPTFPSPAPTHLRVQLLKHRKHDIVDSLNALPKTQHDLNSYVVDLCVQTVSTCFLPHTDQESQSLRPYP
ncbi:nuclear RNA export factor 5 [Rhinolophus ferrumequinum]|uniref:Nuclear RNA export factor 5 n=1 Tax=Rhinolophus ferrumequinum TaxID=59479 RepID=A0A7J8AVZ8_RHIFE|nr:nuclear RNA export factor 5 [Rhinolophus ferrumequinum]